ncbi:hypothetical protein [Roseibium sp.]|uniref:hypothetical protein n=1 Tax=Roseibium sp. TaxID=1936156 RepID=UPI00351382E6
MGAIEANRPECGAAVVICFEWLQRPENAGKGHITWTDYRSKDAPDKIRIIHHKTGEFVYHPLEHIDSNTGESVRLYADAEEILSHLPRRRVSMIFDPQCQSYKANRFW